VDGKYYRLGSSFVSGVTGVCGLWDGGVTYFTDSTGREMELHGEDGYEIILNDWFE
jgi:hypothetical protein